MRVIPNRTQVQAILTRIHEWVIGYGFAPGIVNTDVRWHQQQLASLKSENISSIFTVGDATIYVLLFDGDVEADYVRVFDIHGVFQDALTYEVNNLIEECLAE